MNHATLTVQDLSSQAVRIMVSGELDVYTSPDLKNVLLNELRRSKSMLYVNLEQVTYLDCTGLGVLIGTLKRCREQDAELILELSPQHKVREIIRVTHLEPIFTIQVPADSQKEVCLV